MKRKKPHPATAGWGMIEEVFFTLNGTVDVSHTARLTCIPSA